MIMKKITLLAALLVATTMTFGLMATTAIAGRTIYLNKNVNTSVFLNVYVTYEY